METKALHVKITRGKYRGKKLILPSLESTRSTKSILKGSFFDSLQGNIYETNFIEMFGGSGSMGLEALSLGAKHSYFIEKNPEAFKILKTNCANIDENNTTCVQGDAFELLDKILVKLEGPTILYMDPPFSIRDKMDKIYDQTIQTIQSLNDDKIFLVAIEHMSSLKLPEQLGLFTCKKSKRFGKSSLTLYM